MNIEFATCNKETAFGYLEKVYPSKKLTKEMVSKLLDLVEKDIVRVQDPLMYGNRIGVSQGKKFKPEDKVLVDEAISQMKQNDLL